MPGPVQYRLDDRSAGSSAILRAELGELGWTETSNPDASFWWRASRFAPMLLRNLKRHQVVNHLPNTKPLTQKDQLAASLKLFLDDGSFCSASGPSERPATGLPPTPFDLYSPTTVTTLLSSPCPPFHPWSLSIPTPSLDAVASALSLPTAPPPLPPTHTGYVAKRVFSAQGRDIAIGASLISTLARLDAIGVVAVKEAEAAVIAATAAVAAAEGATIEAKDPSSRRGSVKDAVVDGVGGSVGTGAVGGGGQGGGEVGGGVCLHDRLKEAEAQLARVRAAMSGPTVVQSYLTDVATVLVPTTVALVDERGGVEGGSEGNVPHGWRVLVGGVRGTLPQPYKFDLRVYVAILSGVAGGEHESALPTSGVDGGVGGGKETAGGGAGGGRKPRRQLWLVHVDPILRRASTPYEAAAVRAILEDSGDGCAGNTGDGGAGVASGGDASAAGGDGVASAMRAHLTNVAVGRRAAAAGGAVVADEVECAPLKLRWWAPSVQLGVGGAAGVAGGSGGGSEVGEEIASVMKVGIYDGVVRRCAALLETAAPLVDDEGAAHAGGGSGTGGAAARGARPGGPSSRFGRGGVGGGAAAKSSYGAFELLGLDFLVDSGGTPWLLEANFGPSLSVEDPADTVKGPMVRSLCEMAMAFNNALATASPYETGGGGGSGCGRPEEGEGEWESQSVAASTLTSVLSHQPIPEVLQGLTRTPTESCPWICVGGRVAE